VPPAFPYLALGSAVIFAKPFAALTAAEVPGGAGAALGDPLTCASPVALLATSEGTVGRPQPRSPTTFCESGSQARAQLRCGLSQQKVWKS